MTETFREQLSRVQQMSDGGETWDLSDLDLAALQAVLDDRQRLTMTRRAVTALIEAMRAELHVNDGRHWVNRAQHLDTCVDCKWRMRIIKALTSPAVDVVDLG